MGMFVIGTAGNNDREILNRAGIDQIIDYKGHRSRRQIIAEGF